MVLRVNKALRSALRELAITAKDFIARQIPVFPVSTSFSYFDINACYPRYWICSWLERTVPNKRHWYVSAIVKLCDDWSAQDLCFHEYFYTWIPSRRRTITPVCKYRGEWRVAEKKKVRLKLHCTTEKVLWLLRTDNLFSTVPETLFDC